MARAAARWPNHAGGDEVSEAIIRCVEWREFGNRSTPVRHDHLFAGLHTVEVLAETVFEVADPDLRPRSSYLHGIIVATWERWSMGRDCSSSVSRSLEPTHTSVGIQSPDLRAIGTSGAFLARCISWSR